MYQIQATYIRSKRLIMRLRTTHIGGENGIMGRDSTLIGLFVTWTPAHSQSAGILSVGPLANSGRAKSNETARDIREIAC